MKPDIRLHAALTIDVEDWFHILDSPAVPDIQQWDRLENRIERNLCTILEILARHQVRATFFWLGWAAQRNKHLVRACHDAGHEIASHGYGHILPYKSGKAQFEADISTARKILEDITGDRVHGFRAPGFGIKEETRWAFHVIRKAGYDYDSSIFPGRRGHGGMIHAPQLPCIIPTPHGDLMELGMPMIEILGIRFSVFGGGYLRLAPTWLIRWGIGRLHRMNKPLIIYVHPREIDPFQPRLPLSPWRYFKSYVNLHTTSAKLEWLCQHYTLDTMWRLRQVLRPECSIHDLF